MTAAERQQAREMVRRGAPHGPARREFVRSDAYAQRLDCTCDTLDAAQPFDQLAEECVDFWLIAYWARDADAELYARFYSVPWCHLLEIRVPLGRADTDKLNAEAEQLADDYAKDDDSWV